MSGGGPGAVEVLLPVWGQRHIAQFLEASLPTLLAPGNVPALAARLPCRFILMTRSEDADAIRRHLLWQQLGKVCEAEVRLIDDLISPGNHPITLTLACERAIRAAGAAMRDTCFVLLVADYLLSDGSLATVLARIEAGAGAVLSGTPQVVSEDALPWMEAQARDARGAVALAPRTLMRWALGHLHPATAASFAGDSAAHHARTNRLFWHAGTEAMIGRFYLMHPIAIRPQVSDFTIRAAMDYAFVPEMCPGGQIAVLTDSDDYLALEMQPRAAQAGDVRPGGYRVRWLARSLSDWTTAQHRDNARHTLVFHAGALGPATARATEAADKFLADVARHLTARPQPHRDHPYWIGGMAIHRAAMGDTAHSAQTHRSFEGLLWRLRFAAFGHPPHVTALHARWPEFHVLRRAVQANLKTGQRLHVVAPSPEPFARWLRVSSPAHAAPGTPVSPGDRYEVVALIIPEDEIGRLGELATHGAARLAPSGTMVAWFSNGLADAAAPLPRDVTSDGLRLATFGLAASEMRHIEWAGSRRALQQAQLRLARAARRNRMYLVLAAVAFPLLCGATALANLLALARRGPVRRGASSAVVLTLTAAQSAPHPRSDANPIGAAAPLPAAALEGAAG
jgi:hypothetical protein